VKNEPKESLIGVIKTASWDKIGEPMSNEVKELGVECTQCHKKRGKYAQPWHRCASCGSILCRVCSFSRPNLQCHSCWKKDYDAEQKKRKETPLECNVCHQTKLPKEFQGGSCDFLVTEGPYTSWQSGIKLPQNTCTLCAKQLVEAAHLLRKTNAIPGLVEVQYGEHPCPTTDGGHGYAYYFGEPLALGDIVAVPPSYLARYRPESSVATVVSTYSEYQGPTSSILRVIKKAKEPMP
jgi:hypothetical protein